MDYEVLNRVADIAKRCVLAQDTTDLWEVMDPNCRIQGFQDATGETSEAAASGSAALIDVRGAANVGRLTARMFAWLQNGPCIVQPQTEAEVKRRRPVAQSQQAAQSASASTPRRAKAMLSDVPDDPTTNSTVTLTYGRPALQFVDTYYVSEEGKIQLVVRKLAEAPQDPAVLPQYAAERSAFFAKVRQTVNAPVARVPVLDFTFAGVVQPSDMLRVTPSSGKRHTFAPLEVKKELDAAHRDFQQPGGRGAKKKLIKAKNRQGEEEAYEFTLEVDATRAAVTLDSQRADPKKEEDDKISALAAQMGGKYVSDAVRLSSNSMSDGTAVVKIVRNLVANYYLTISWLDLSCNRLHNLPAQLSNLPLSTLYVHSNNITDWKEVLKVTALPRLTSVTFFGNPVAAAPDYKNTLLGALMCAPDKEIPIKSIDFVALSGVDKELTDHHLRRVSKGATRLPGMSSAPSTPRR